MSANLDEFQSFLRLPVSAEKMLAKARSFKLGMRLAHQNLDQLRSMPELHSAVMNNARNKIMFQLGSDDASKMAREFRRLLTPHDFQMLRQYEAFARVVAGKESASPSVCARFRRADRQPMSSRYASCHVRSMGGRSSK